MSRRSLGLAALCEGGGARFLNSFAMLNMNYNRRSLHKYFYPRFVRAFLLLSQKYIISRDVFTRVLAHFS